MLNRDFYKVRTSTIQGVISELPIYCNCVYTIIRFRNGIKPYNLQWNEGSIQYYSIGKKSGGIYTRIDQDIKSGDNIPIDHDTIILVSACFRSKWKLYLYASRDNLDIVNILKNYPEYQEELTDQESGQDQPAAQESRESGQERPAAQESRESGQDQPAAQESRESGQDQPVTQESRESGQDQQQQRESKPRAELRRNYRKCGIEIIFRSERGADHADIIKEMLKIGYRYSRRRGLWYIKYTAAIFDRSNALINNYNLQPAAATIHQATTTTTPPPTTPATTAAAGDTWQQRESGQDHQDRESYESGQDPEPEPAEEPGGYYVILKDRRGNLRFTANCPAYRSKGDGQILYIELQSKSPQALRAIWANLVKGRPERSVTRTDVSLFLRGAFQDYIKVYPGEKLHKIETGDRLILIHNQADKLSRHYIHSESDSAPPAAFAAALQQNINIPFLPAWLPELWTAAKNNQALKELSGHGPSWYFISTRAEKWQAIIKNLYKSGRLAGTATYNPETKKHETITVL